MVRFVGCDVHKQTAVFTVLLVDGTIHATHSVVVTREALAHFAEEVIVIDQIDLPSPN